MERPLAMPDNWIVLAIYLDSAAASATLVRTNAFTRRHTQITPYSASGQYLASRAVPASGTFVNYQQWLLPGETFLATRVTSEELDQTLSALRQSPGGSPVMFSFRCTQNRTSAAEAVTGHSNPRTMRGIRSAALTLASRLPLDSQRSRGATLLQRVKQCEVNLKEVDRGLQQRKLNQQSPSMASALLLDNAFILQEHVEEFRRNLPRSFYNKLPIIADGPYAGLPRIYGLAADLITEQDTRLDTSRIFSFVHAFQSVTPLSIGELWAMPQMIRIRLIECIQQLAIKVEGRENEGDVADFLANRILTATRTYPGALAKFVTQMERDYPLPSAHLADQLLDYLFDEELAISAIQSWLESGVGSPLSSAIQQERLDQSAQQLSLSDAISSLRRLSNLDWRSMFEDLSLVHAELARDPVNTYSHMDFPTRDHYRVVVENLSRECGETEIGVANHAVSLAERGEDELRRHVGYYLVDEGKPQLDRICRRKPPLWVRMTSPIDKARGEIYIFVILCLSLIAASWFIVETVNLQTSLVIVVLCSVFVLLTASELATNFVNYLITRIISPRFVPSMSYKDGMPADCTTLVVVPMMLLTAESIKKEVEHLEIRYLANMEDHLYFGLLSDFSDGPQRDMPEDGEHLDVITREVERLNSKYGEPKFFLFHRPRTWCACENRWIGWERKRGKLEQLNRYLSGASTALPERYVRVGDESCLKSIRYVITLDADTQLPRDTARRMVETISHPLNKAVLSKVDGKVVRGYTIVQPSVRTSLPSAMATRFSRIFTDTSGTDPYGATSSDVNHDLVDEGSYYGKGIYDLAVFHEQLSGRFPESHLLSHDLLEGSHVRVGMATNIELLDLFPADYLAYTRRQHRWTRGDWQIIDWLFRQVPHGDNERERNILSPFCRWKIGDNLRRSLLPIAEIILLVAAWYGDASPVRVSLLVALVLFLPFVNQVMNGVTTRPASHRTTWRLIVTALAKSAFQTSMLPYEAYSSLDAIVRVVYRRYISHSLLLEWETAQETHRKSRNRQTKFITGMLWISLASFVFDLVLFGSHTTTWLVAQPFLLLWIFSPAITYWINTPTKPIASQKLGDVDRTFLRQSARECWRFFAEFVGAQSNWLPPDNFQETLRVEVAPRTSPTNIGLSLMAPYSAFDFGYITADEVLARTLHTFESINKLERYEGHLLNWYNILSLEPLYPRYVSMVDSGNLLGSLWALEAATDDISTAPIVSARCFQGLRDTLRLLVLAMHKSKLLLPPLEKSVSTLDTLCASQALTLHEMVISIRQLATTAEGLATLTDDREGEVNYWLKQVSNQIAAWNNTVDVYLGWIELLANPPETSLLDISKDAHTWVRQALRCQPTLRMLARGEVPGLRSLAMMHQMELDIAVEATEWLRRVAEAEHIARTAAEKLVSDAGSVLEQVQALAHHTNMRFLYDTDRNLFNTGYNVSDQRMDPGHYDLLASEARLGSFVAIARGDVPIEHWWSLGRPFGIAYGRRVLLSWSGTMFEYLMPLLLTKSFENSILDDACRTAVACQIAYGAQRSIPWGISEAAFSALDVNKTYQYRAFGVPGLGIKRGLESDTVVSPYATALALPLAPSQCTRNLQHLAGIGVHGSYGFYEAIDFTRQHIPRGDRGVIVYAYMAHHQGMTFAAIDNVVNSDIWQNRFHTHPAVQATESLLYERIPTDPAIVKLKLDKELVPKLKPVTITRDSTISTPNTAYPRTQLLSNGAYSVMITNSGGGYSRWNDLDISRWRADTTCDAYGSFCYVKDLHSGAVWSTTYQPTRKTPQRFTCTFTADKAVFTRRDEGIEISTEVAVSPEDNVEVRRITLINRSPRDRYLEITSYQEVALATHNADRAHPAFSKLFIEMESRPELDALIAHRRPRASTERQFWAVHATADDASFEMFAEYETDREQFIGRCRTLANPASIDRPLSNSHGYVLDPVFSLRRRVTLKPGQRAEIAFMTGAADSRETVIALAEKYNDLTAVHRAFEMAWTYAQLEMRHLRIIQDEAHLIQQIAGHMIYPSPLLRQSPETVIANEYSQSRLWPYGISGDLPVCVLSIGSDEKLDLVRQVLTAHSYWRARGLKTDLVILNEEGATYDQPLQRKLQSLVTAHADTSGVTAGGTAVIQQVYLMPHEDRAVMLGVARVVLVAARGDLSQQLAIPAQVAAPAGPLIISNRMPEEASAELPFMELSYFNGTGGFTRDGREYAIYLSPALVAPMPWINVIANPLFGTTISEAGSGFTWYENSQTNRLTPWSNDPVSDEVGEAIYLRDDDMDVVWTPTPLPIREQDAYRIRHGQGYTLFEHNSHAIEQQLTTFVPVNDSGGAPVKLQILRLTNHSSRRRRLTITHYADLVLGSTREECQMHVRTEWVSAHATLLARNPYLADYGDRVTFAACSQPVTSYTCDRTAFLGRNGSNAAPFELRRIALSRATGSELDPCFALQCSVEIEPQQSTEIVFLLGQAANAEEAHELVARYREVNAAHACLDEAKAWWDSALSTLELQTPDEAANLLLNRWLLYQALSCRLWARSAFYQSGGAFGFRDQLQDIMALVYSKPHLAREQILKSAERQFEDGDVQHWWLPPTGMGVRTRMSDDLLWLPFVTAQYVRVTRDTSILSQQVPFITSKPIDDGELEIFNTPGVSLLKADLLEHCRRAVKRANTAGAHGLPLIGTGDWNDSLSRVGVEGKGESVWLAWFLAHVMNDLAELLTYSSNLPEALRWQEEAARVAATVEKEAWDGAWYLRAFFDDGTAVGSAASLEDQIDSLAQSWAVISGMGSTARYQQAMNSADSRLVRTEEKIVLLFTPPFDKTPLDPGYIKGYPPGVRENGGQYTHGSLWMPMAFARMGTGNRAVELLSMMNPIEHSRNPEDAQRYKAEPYAVAADIYNLKGSEGRAGWSWYTGAAAWMYRIWLEEVLGFEKRGDKLTIKPSIHESWNGFTISYRYGSAHYEIVVDNSGHHCTGVTLVELDGTICPGGTITLCDDGRQHAVAIVMGSTTIAKPVPVAAGNAGRSPIS